MKDRVTYARVAQIVLAIAPVAATNVLKIHPAFATFAQVTDAFVGNVTSMNVLVKETMTLVMLLVAIVNVKSV